MLAGGTEHGQVWNNPRYTKLPDGSYIHQTHTARWYDTFSLMGNGTNLAAGPVALFMFTMLGMLAMPYFRRNNFEMFYFLHIQFFFMGNLAVLFHSRTQALPWLAPALLLFYIDFPIRIIAKLCTVNPVSMELVGDSIVKLVLKIDSFPLGAFSYHPGSYLWLSCNLRNQPTVPTATTTENVKETELTTVEASSCSNDSSKAYEKVATSEMSDSNSDKSGGGGGIFAPVKVPGGPPSGLPSWLWFHPITISSYNLDTHEVTVYIKKFGEGNKEWSGQLLAAAKCVADGTLTLNDIGFHVGGPNGSLMIKEPLESLSHVIMLSGGIGCTPMVAVLEDLINNDYSGHVDYVWSTRSVDEINAFAPLFNRCQGRENFHIRIHFTSTKNESSPENGPPPSGPGYEVILGRPNYDKLEVVKGEATGVLCCGPSQLMIAAESFAIDKQRQGMNILFHRETFEF